MEKKQVANLCLLVKRNHEGDRILEVDDFSTTDETDESILEALEWWLTALTPSIPFMGYYLDSTKEERLDRLYRSAGVMTVTGSALYLAGAGSSLTNPATLQGSMAMQVEKFRMLGSTVARTGVFVGRGLLSPIFGALATAVTGAWAYEMYVNNPLRDSHPEDIDWFGPFASGFGTVV